MTLKSRLLAKIDICSEAGCWNWTASKSSGRYGKLEISGATLSAHRASYEVYRGPIPEGLFVCHRCDNPACINPDHLFLGTHADNMADKVKKGRHRTPRGSEVVTSKLTEADVLAIRASRVSNGCVAEQYGVDRSLISLIRTGKRWAHLRPPSQAEARC